MANLKTGLAYYNVETDRYQDIKVKRLKKDFGCNGIAVYDYLLCEIYRDKGCFLEWDESTVFDVAEYFGLKENLVKEIVNYCAYVGLFNKELLCREKVLTSRSIQQRYIETCVRAKRKNFKIPEEYKIITEESFKLPEECQETPEVCDKGRKGSKENNLSIISPLGIDPKFGDEILPIDKVKSEIIEWHYFWIETIARNKLIPTEKVEEYLNTFLGELDNRGICEKSIKNFKDHFANWLNKELKETSKDETREQQPPRVYRRKK